MDAAIALLCEGGWQAVTTRGVAERADTNAGLIHYHFGGLPGLHAAIIRRAGELVINPLVAELLDAADEWAALAAVHRLLPETTGDERTARLAAELLAGATRDPALGEVLRDQLREARTQLAGRIRQLRPGWSPERATGVATLVAALIDGLMLHYMIDHELPVGEALTGVADLLRNGKD
ncbi:TetR/AcrR family transcriptional regulator [Nonomuraea sp. NPDC049714]|uniref:TetR/AcrR family transcriptional regulator n=1 Tax=Nonomuraea sp. NPDC049714 TaxID=3364357 RepID=UPI0037B063F1